MKNWTKENKKTLRNIEGYAKQMETYRTPDTKVVCWMENGRLRYSWTRNPIGEKI